MHFVLVTGNAVACSKSLLNPLDVYLFASHKGTAHFLLGWLHIAMKAA